MSIPTTIKTTEQYEQLTKLVKKYHLLQFLAINHKSGLLFPEDVKLVSITYPNGCVLHYYENNTWKTVVHKTAFTTNITSISLGNDSHKNIVFVKFFDSYQTKHLVQSKYNVILKYIYDGKTYTTNNIIQKQLIKN